LISNAIINFVPNIISKYILEIPSQATDEECALLFTSGSSGQPKGVVLTHDNILSNCEGIALVGNFPSNSRILANLPLFHSFGFTVTLWFSLLNNIRIITVPSPLEINKTIKAIEDEQVTVLLGTPTFLGGYLRKGSSNKFKSLQYVIAGAEKSKLEFIKQWENLAECTYLEGYGLTETSPVLSLNSPQHGIKHGTVGRLLPNIKVKTIHPDTHENLKMHQSGILCFQGPSIFKEYLGDKEKTKATFKDGWFVTGDIGKLDEQGFIVIEGRLSRFSKIGGEMIPHETIEAEAIKILDWQHDDQIKLVIVGIPHDRKGEELYLITTENINFTNLRSELSKQLGNLFVPKKHKIVNEIPVLATGKLDLQTLKELVY
jgi:acyl-[acyl-carrier-protein]-phospholipid O-acyltransferase/long-chain-fatty-acid--[acyl-carrier-protein] ligase